MNRIEEIMSGIESALKGLYTTQNNVERRRGWKWPEGTLACIELHQGSVDPVGDPSFDSQQARLSFEVMIEVAAENELPETRLNRVDAEVYKVLMVQGQNFGLAYVEFVEWRGNSEVDINPAEYTQGRMSVEYVVQFRHSEFDRES